MNAKVLSKAQKDGIRDAVRRIPNELLQGEGKRAQQLAEAVLEGGLRVSRQDLMSCNLVSAVAQAITDGTMTERRLCVSLVERLEKGRAAFDGATAREQIQKQFGDEEATPPLPAPGTPAGHKLGKKAAPPAAPKPELPELTGQPDDLIAAFHRVNTVAPDHNGWAMATGYRRSVIAKHKQTNGAEKDGYVVWADSFHHPVFVFREENVFDPETKTTFKARWYADGLGHEKGSLVLERFVIEGIGGATSYEVMKAVGAWTEPAELKKAADERVAARKADGEAKPKGEVLGERLQEIAAEQLAEVHPASGEPDTDEKVPQETATDDPSYDEAAQQEAEQTVKEAFSPGEDAAKVTGEFIAETVGSDA
jgi:hypothetical protein